MADGIGEFVAAKKGSDFIDRLWVDINRLPIQNSRLQKALSTRRRIRKRSNNTYIYFLAVSLSHRGGAIRQASDCHYAPSTADARFPLYVVVVVIIPKTVTCLYFWWWFLYGYISLCLCWPGTEAKLIRPLPFSLNIDWMELLAWPANRK